MIYGFFDVEPVVEVVRPRQRDSGDVDDCSHVSCWSFVEARTDLLPDIIRSVRWVNGVTDLVI